MIILATCQLVPKGSHTRENLGWGVPVKLRTKYQISYPYIEIYGFYSHVKIYELLDWRAYKCFGLPSIPYYEITINFSAIYHP